MPILIRFIWNRCIRNPTAGNNVVCRQSLPRTIGSLGKSGFETTEETLRESRVRDHVRMVLRFQNKTIRRGAKYRDP